MKVNNPRFEISAVSPLQYPKGNLLEIAFAGRSNAGKSSLINALLNRKKLAFSGSRQGMTRTLNFYNIDDEIYFVDLPGYGFAKAPGNNISSWAKVIDDYFNKREKLYLCILLVDIRINPSEDDCRMADFLEKSGINYIVVANKADKISKSEYSRQCEKIKSALCLPPEKKIFPVSCPERTGIDSLWREIDSYIVE